MSSAAMASSSLSQEDVENDFEKSSRRSRIRMARGRDVRGLQPTAAAACRLGDGGTEHEEGAEAAGGRAADLCGYPGDHDASPKPSVRPKDKRPARPSHVNKGKPQRDRRKLREKRRSTGVVHMPSSEVSSTGGSTYEGDEELATPAVSAETHRNTQQNEFTDPCVELATDTASRSLQKPQLRNKSSQSDLDADDEANQEAESPGRHGATAQKPRTNGQPTAALRQLEEENHRLERALLERDQRIAGLEAELARSRQEKKHLAYENSALIRAMEALSAK